jgi:capsular exopolysaccharide synthesis family protein
MNTEVIPPGAPQEKKNFPSTRGSRPEFHAAKEVREPGIALHEIWRILRKRAAIIRRVAMGVVAIAVVYTLVQTPMFRSEATIESNEQDSNSVVLDDQHQPGTDVPTADYVLMQKSEVKALQSDTLALRVIKEMKLEPPPEAARKLSFAALIGRQPDDPALPLEVAPQRRVEALAAFHRALTVAAVPGTRMISVQFMHPNPQTAALVVNTLLKDYKDLNFQSHYADNIEVSGWLSKQLDDLRTEVASSEQKLVDYQKQAGILGTDESHNVVMTRLEEGSKQLSDAQEKRIVTQTIVELVRQGNPELVSDLMNSLPAAAPAASTHSLSVIQDLRHQQSEARTQYAEAAAQYGMAHPKLIGLASRVDQLDQLIQQEIRNLKVRAENDYVAAQQNERALRGAFEDEKQEANQLNDSAVQYTILKHEVESNRTLYDSLLKKFKEALVLASMRGSNIRIVDEALVPDRPARPQVLLNLLLGVTLGLLCGIGSAFAAESLDQTIGTAEEAEEVTGVPVLGAVPKWSLPGRNRTAPSLPPGTVPAGVRVLGHSGSQSAEAFRAIRTTIIQSIRPGISTPIVVTSASSGEGKSSVSLNCAAAFAQQGARVLLVEADLRQPVLSASLNLDRSSGLSSILQGETCPELPLTLPEFPTLAVIPAGPQTSYPSELLGSPRMKELITDWRGKYDYIFFDTPPALAVTDAAVLASVCDLVILVARANLTQRPALKRVSTLCARLRPRVLGVILNGLAPDSPQAVAYYGHAGSIEPTGKTERLL